MNPGEERKAGTPCLNAALIQERMTTLADVVPKEIFRSIEWQNRTIHTNPRPRAGPVFETPRRAVLVCDVARPWGGKPQMITSVLPGKPMSFTLRERAGSTSQPILCFRTVDAACRAPQKPGVFSLPRRTERMLLLLEVGVAGNGMAGVSRARNGALLCNTVKAVALAPLPKSHVAKAMPPPIFWLPGNGHTYPQEEAKEEEEETNEDLAAQVTRRALEAGVDAAVNA